MAALASGCAASDPQPRAAPATDLRHVADAADRLSFDLPPGWHHARQRLLPDLADPVEILSLGTYPLGSPQPYDPGERCYPPIDAPVPALDRFAADDVFVSIQKRRGRGTAYPPRQRPFDHRRLDLELGHGSRDCLDERLGWIGFTPFQDGERRLYAFVVVGRSASARRRRELQTILDSLALAPRPPRAVRSLVLSNGRVVESRSRGHPAAHATALVPFAHGTFAVHCDSRRGRGLEAAVSLAVAPGQATLTGRAKVGDGRATTFRVDPGQQVATALSSATHQTWLVRYRHKPAPQLIRLDVDYQPIPGSRACAVTRLDLRSSSPR